MRIRSIDFFRISTPIALADYMFFPPIPPWCQSVFSICSINFSSPMRKLLGIVFVSTLLLLQVDSDSQGEEIVSEEHKEHSTGNLELSDLNPQNLIEDTIKRVKLLYENFAMETSSIFSYESLHRLRELTEIEGATADELKELPAGNPELPDSNPLQPLVRALRLADISFYNFIKEALEVISGAIGEEFHEYLGASHANPNFSGSAESGQEECEGGSCSESYTEAVTDPEFKSVGSENISSASSGKNIFGSFSFTFNPNI